MSGRVLYSAVCTGPAEVHVLVFLLETVSIASRTTGGRCPRGAPSADDRGALRSLHLAREHLAERPQGALSTCVMRDTRRSWWAAPCATCCSACIRRISTSRPTRSPRTSGGIFRNCRLIGRRFRLAHVRFGHEIIEVATFRAAHTEVDEDHAVDEVEHRAHDEHGRILRDNLYGTIDEDVWRRDFTANALYYNIEDFSIWDYVGGVQDAGDRVAPHDRRSRDALSRGPGAHAASRAFRREARLHAASRAPRRRSIAWPTCSTRCPPRGSSTRS